jgi:hypothetical protein
MRDQVLQPGRAAEPLPDHLAGYRDVDVAIGGLEYTGRNRCRVVVAGLFRHLAVHQPAGRLKIQQRDLRLQQ